MNRKNNHFTMGLGIPSLLMVFTILAMVILSLLGYMKEEINYKIVDKEVEYTIQYYSADSRAKYEFAKNDDVDIRIEINDKQELEAVKHDGVIIRYQVIQKED